MLDDFPREASCARRPVNMAGMTAAPVAGQLYTWGRNTDGQCGQTEVAHPPRNCALPHCNTHPPLQHFLDMLLHALKPHNAIMEEADLPLHQPV